MRTKKIALILIGLSFLEVQASNNDFRNLLIGSAAVAVGTVGSIYTWRAMTQHQDRRVIDNIDKELNEIAYYKDANDLVKEKGARDLEDKVVQVRTKITKQEDISGIEFVVEKDLRKVESLRNKTLSSWDFWMRSWFSSQVGSCVDVINKRKKEVEDVRLFLVEENKGYFEGWQSAIQGRKLVEKINPCYLDNDESEVSSIDQEMLLQSICKPDAFGSEKLPLYTCNTALSKRIDDIAYKTSSKYDNRYSSYAVYKASRNPISMYKELNTELTNVKSSLNLLSVIIKNMPAYQTELAQAVKAEKKRAMAQKAEELHRAQLQAARAQEIAAQAQLEQAQAAKAQAKAQQDQADINRRRLTVEERNTAIRRRAEVKQITEAEAKQELESEEALILLAGVAIKGAVNLLCTQSK